METRRSIMRKLIENLQSQRLACVARRQSRSLAQGNKTASQSESDKALASIVVNYDKIISDVIKLDSDSSSRPSDFRKSLHGLRDTFRHKTTGAIEEYKVALRNLEYLIGDFEKDITRLLLTETIDRLQEAHDQDNTKSYVSIVTGAFGPLLNGRDDRIAVSGLIALVEDNDPFIASLAMIMLGVLKIGKIDTPGAINAIRSVKRRQGKKIVTISSILSLDILGDRDARNQIVDLQLLGKVDASDSERMADAIAIVSFAIATGKD